MRKLGALEGAEWTDRNAAETESFLDVEPEDCKARVGALGYYETRQWDSPEVRNTRRRHLIWLVTNLSEHPFLCRGLFSVNRDLEPELYRELCKLWESAVSKNSDSTQLLLNAACFWMRNDLEYAEELLAKAAKISPTYPEVDRIKTRFLTFRNLFDEGGNA